MTPAPRRIAYARSNHLFTTCRGNLGRAKYFVGFVHGRVKPADWAAIHDLWFRDPWTIHCAGGNKPWIASDPATPLDAVWWKFATASPVAKNIKNDYLAARRAAATPYDKIPRRLR